MRGPNRNMDQSMSRACHHVPPKSALAISLVSVIPFLDSAFAVPDCSDVCGHGFRDIVGDGVITKAEARIELIDIDLQYSLVSEAVLNF